MNKEVGRYIRKEHMSLLKLLVEEHADEVIDRGKRANVAKELHEVRELYSTLIKPTASSDKRHDVLDTLGSETNDHTLRDYEGFLGEDEIHDITFLVLKWGRELEKYQSAKLTEVVRDITANILVELAQYDEENPIPPKTSKEYTIWDDRAITLIHTLTDLFTVRYWTKSHIDWEEQKKQYQDAGHLPNDY